MDRFDELLRTARTIAVVGLSDNPERPSYRVAAYLQSKGYRIIPVNPRCSSILNERCYPDLASVPGPIDIVDVFRKSEDVMPVAEEAARLDVRCFWMQLGVANAAARKLLESKGVFVVEDRCLKIVHAEREQGLS